METTPKITESYRRALEAGAQLSPDQTREFWASIGVVIVGDVLDQTHEQVATRMQEIGLNPDVINLLEQ